MQSFNNSNFDPETISKLPVGAPRFLACIIEHGLKTGMRRPEDFIRHFTPEKLMLGLARNNKLRAAILHETTGIMRQIAEKKTPESAGADLQIAIDEQITSASVIMELVSPDRRVQIFDPHELWDYVVESEFWKGGEKDSAARTHLQFMIERAIAEGLVTHEDIVGGMGIPNIVDCLPKTQLATIISHALEMGQVKKFFRAEDLMSAVTPAILVAHIPMEVLWERIVVERIAEPYGFVSPRSGTQGSRQASPMMPTYRQQNAPARPAPKQSNPLPQTSLSQAPAPLIDAQQRKQTVSKDEGVEVEDWFDDDGDEPQNPFGDPALGQTSVQDRVPN